MLSPLHYNLCYTQDIQHKVHPTSATCTTHSTQSLSNQCYTHDIQHKVLSTCATCTTLSSSQPVLHVQCKLFPTSAAHTTFNVKSSSQPVTNTTFSAKSVQSKWSAFPSLCQFNSFARLGMNQPPNLFKICWQANGTYVHCTEWQDYHNAHRTTQVDLTLQETLCWMRGH